MAIQRLMSGNLIQAREKSGDSKKLSDERKYTAVREFTLTPEAEQIFAELMIVLNDFEQIQFEGYSQEEIELFDKLNERRKENIRRALR